MVVMTQKCHKTHIWKKLGACFFPFFISSHKGVVTCVENRHRNMHACLISINSSTVALSVASVTRPAAFNKVFYRLHVSLRHEDWRWVMIQGITMTTFPDCLIALLSKACINADNNISTRNRISTWRSANEIDCTHRKASLWCSKPPKHVGQHCRRYSLGPLGIVWTSLRSS